MPPSRLETLGSSDMTAVAHSQQELDDSNQCRPGNTTRERVGGEIKTPGEGGGRRVVIDQVETIFPYGASLSQEFHVTSQA